MLSFLLPLLSFLLSGAVGVHLPCFVFESDRGGPCGPTPSPQVPVPGRGRYKVQLFSVTIELFPTGGNKHAMKLWSDGGSAVTLAVLKSKVFYRGIYQQCLACSDKECPFSCGIWLHLRVGDVHLIKLWSVMVLTKMTMGLIY